MLNVGCGEGRAVSFFHRLGVIAHGIEGLRLNVRRALANAAVVAMTHAVPGQAGHHHVDCQPPGYWIERMRLRSYRLDPAPATYRQVAATDPMNFFQQTVWYSYANRPGRIDRARPPGHLASRL